MIHLSRQATATNHLKSQKAIWHVAFLLDTDCFVHHKGLASMKTISCSHTTENAHECQTLCKQTPNCTTFSYATKDNSRYPKACCLRSGPLKKFNDKDHVISGPATCPGEYIDYQIFRTQYFCRSFKKYVIGLKGRGFNQNREKVWQGGGGQAKEWYHHFKKISFEQPH